jgi:hypothetical protein
MENIENAYNIYDDFLKMERATFADGSNIVPYISSEQFRGKKYVTWRDPLAEMDYPNKLLELYYNSSLHHSIVDMKAELIAGQGFELVDPNSPNAAKTMEFIKAVNFDGDDLNAVNQKVSLDLVLFNMISSQIIFRKDWSYVDSVKHIEIAKMRRETPDDKGYINGYYWSFDWSKYRPSKLIYLEEFNVNKVLERKNNYKEIEGRILSNNPKENDLNNFNSLLNINNTLAYVYRTYQPNSFYYSTPEYLAIIPNLEIDILSDVYATSSLKNGMDNGNYIIMIGNPNQPESKRTAKQLLIDYSGARKAGKPVIVWADSKADAPEIRDISNSNSLANKYKIINESVQQKILTGHRIPNSSMVGIQVAGKLGDSNNAVENQEIFFNNYVKPKQQLLENYWNKIMEFNNLDKIRIIKSNIFNTQAIESKEAGLVTPENNNQVI